MTIFSQKSILVATALVFHCFVSKAQNTPPVPPTITKGAETESTGFTGISDAGPKANKKTFHARGANMDLGLEVSGLIKADSLMGDGSLLTNLKTVGSPVQNVIVVAKSGGDFTTISSALLSITDQSSQNRYLISIGPGIYKERVEMKKFVDIAGSGPNLTQIIFPSSGSLETVYTADSCELRDLTVLNDGSGSSSFALAINNMGTDPTIRNVKALSYGASFNYTIYSTIGANPTLIDVSVFAGEGSAVVGHYISHSNARHRRCQFQVLDDVNDNGIYMAGGGGSGGPYEISLTNCTIEANIRHIRTSNGFHCISALNQLIGDGIIEQSNGGSIACVSCFEENGLMLDAACQ